LSATRAMHRRRFSIRLKGTSPALASIIARVT
jgi:hypothetical protein